MKRLLVISIVLLLASASAQIDEKFVENMLGLDDWLTDMETKFSPWFTPLEDIARQLIKVGLAITAFVLMFGGAKLLGSLSRVLLALVLIMFAPNINSFFMSAWNTARITGSAALVETFREGSKDFERLADASEDLMITSSLIPSGRVLEVIGATANMVGMNSFTKIRESMINKTALALPAFIIVVMVAFLLLVGSAFLINIAGLVIYLAAGLLAVPHAPGAAWLGNYFRMSVGAILFVLILPIGFDTAYSLTAGRAIDTVATATEKNLADLNKMFTDVGTETDRLKEIETLEAKIVGLEEKITDVRQDSDNWTKPKIFKRLNAASKAKVDGWNSEIKGLKKREKDLETTWIEKVGNTITTATSRLARGMDAFLVSAAVMTMGLIGSVFIILRLESMVAGLVGGMVMGAANSIAGMAIGAAALGGRGGSRRGASSGNSTGTKREGTRPIPPTSGGGGTAPTPATSVRTIPGTNVVRSYQPYGPVPQPTPRFFPADMSGASKAPERVVN